MIYEFVCSDTSTCLPVIEEALQSNKISYKPDLMNKDCHWFRYDIDDISFQELKKIQQFERLQDLWMLRFIRPVIFG